MVLSLPAAKETSKLLNLVIHTDVIYMLNVGDRAPDPGAYNQKAEVINLRYFPGRHFLIFFYEGDDECEALLREFQSLHEDIKRLNAILVGVSRDSMLVHRATVDALGIDYHLIADLDAKACLRFKVLNKGEEGMKARRATFIVGPDHLVWYASPDVNPKQALAKLEELSRNPPKIEAKSAEKTEVHDNRSSQTPPDA